MKKLEALGAPFLILAVIYLPSLRFFRHFPNLDLSGLEEVLEILAAIIFFISLAYFLGRQLALRKPNLNFAKGFKVCLVPVLVFGALTVLVSDFFGWIAFAAVCGTLLCLYASLVRKEASLRPATEPVAGPMKYRYFLAPFVFAAIILGFFFSHGLISFYETAYYQFIGGGDDFGIVAISTILLFFGVVLTGLFFSLVSVIKREKSFFGWGLALTSILVASAVWPVYYHRDLDCRQNEQCVLEHAAKNIEYCDKSLVEHHLEYINDDLSRADGCYAQMAVHEKQPELCENIKDLSGDQPSSSSQEYVNRMKATCYANLSKVVKDSNICKNMPVVHLYRLQASGRYDYDAEPYSHYKDFCLSNVQ